jgi:hypothetical protein
MRVKNPIGCWSWAISNIKCTRAEFYGVIVHELASLLTTISELDLHILPALRIANWPVPATCCHFQDAIVSTHVANPLPAYMSGSDEPICPADYTWLLGRAVVKVHFTLSHLDLQHCYIPRSHFNATLQRIIVLQEHLPADLDVWSLIW